MISISTPIINVERATYGVGLNVGNNILKIFCGDVFPEFPVVVQLPTHNHPKMWESMLSLCPVIFDCQSYSEKLSKYWREMR